MRALRMSHCFTLVSPFLLALAVWLVGAVFGCFLVWVCFCSALSCFASARGCFDYSSASIRSR